MKKRTITVLALVAHLFAAGCVSIPLESERTGVRTIKRNVRTVGVDLRAVRPVVLRSNDSATIRLELDGVFTDRTTETGSCVREPRRMLSFGFFPGLANDKPADLAGDALRAVWLNVCFLGTPTVNGILVEPLNPVASDSSDSFSGPGMFSRSSLVGFHKYVSRKERVELPETSSDRSVEDVRPLQNVALKLSARPPFWERQSAADGTISLEGVERGAHEALLEIVSIPATHPYRDCLAGLEGTSFEISIPAK